MASANVSPIKVSYIWEPEFLKMYERYKEFRLIGVKWSFRIPEDKDLNAQIEKIEILTSFGPETSAQNDDMIGSIPLT